MSGRGGAPRRPRPARAGTSHGYTLVEVVFAAGLVAVLAAAAIPQLSAGVERSRTVGAARYLASRLALARAQAAARSANVAVLLTATEGTFVVGTYVDGNGDGVRTRDISAGLDTLIDVPADTSSWIVSSSNEATRPKMPDPSITSDPTPNADCVAARAC